MKSFEDLLSYSVEEIEAMDDEIESFDNTYVPIAELPAMGVGIDDIISDEV